MRVSPTDIRQQSFTVRLFRGFDLQEVDAFLEDVAEDLEFAIKENTTLREQLAAMEERMRAVGEREKILQETLVTTQRLTEEMKEAAKREAGLHVREAELQGEKIVESARGEEARILNDVQMLKRTRRQLVEEIRSTLETYQRWLSEFSGESGDATPKP
jgi:cell division initiation protein